MPLIPKTEVEEVVKDLLTEDQLGDLLERFSQTTEHKFASANYYRIIGIIPKYLVVDISKSLHHGRYRDKLSSRHLYAREAVVWILFAESIITPYPKRLTQRYEIKVGRIFDYAVRIWGKDQHTLSRLIALYEKEANHDFLIFEKMFFDNIEISSSTSLSSQKRQPGQLDSYYDKPYNAAVTQENQNHLRKLAEANDSQSLLTASDVYSILFDLLMLDTPEPNYPADILDKNTLHQILDKAMEALPEDEREAFENDVSIVKGCIDQKLYEAAKQFLRERSLQLEDAISTVEPPSHIKAFLEALSEPE